MTLTYCTASNSSVFKMRAVEGVEICVTTADVGLQTSTSHVIQEYRASSTTKECSTVGGDNCEEERDGEGG